MPQEDLAHADNPSRRPIGAILHHLGVLLGLSKDDDISYLEDLRKLYNSLLDKEQPSTLTNIEKIDRMTEISRGIYERRKSIAANRIAIAGLAFALSNAALGYLNYSLASAIRGSGNKEIQVTIKSAPGLSVRVDAPIAIRKVAGERASEQSPRR
jgi:hypothetical protein